MHIGDQASCYVAHFCCTSLNTCHVHCTLLLYFAERISCYVAHFCCTCVTKHHVTLHTSVLLWCPKVLAHFDAIDNGWEACKNMLPGSFPSHTPMIMPHDICQSLAYIEMFMPRLGIHRNADVCDNTTKTVRKLNWWNGIAGDVAKRNNMVFCVFWRCSTCIFEFPLQ